MADSFDPYHKWLGISPKDQPPNHYRLLAIEPFESDPDVIEGAADRLMAHLRTFQAGAHSAHSQKLLNECAAARLTLLDPQKRAEYDRQLREKLAVSTALPLPSEEGRGEGTSPRSRPQLAASPQPVPVAKPLPRAAPMPIAEVVPLSASDEEDAPALVRRRVTRKIPLWRQPAVLGTVGALVIFGAIAYALSRSGNLPTDVAATNSNPNSVNTVSPAPSIPDKPAPPKTEKSSPAPAVAPPVQASSKADFEILAATWGADDKWADVTEGLRGQVKDNRLMIIVWSDLFGKPADPAPGIGKKLRIRYRSRGKEYTAEYFDSWFVYLDGNPLAPPTKSPDALELLEARHGAGGTFVDVLPQLRPHTADGRLSVAADAFGNATAAELEKYGVGAQTFKVLWVRYRNRTGEHFTYAWNSQPLTIDTRLPPTAGRPVDLLRLIELPRHVVHGDWSMKDGKLLAPSQELAARVLIPYRVPSDYALTLTVESDGQLAEVEAGLVVGGHQAVATIDTGTELSFSGIAMVNRLWHSDDKNPSKTWRLARMLEQGRPNKLTYIVRPTSVRVLRDGAEIVRWSGDPGTLSVPDTWQVTDPHKLYLQSCHFPYRITDVELTPLAPETAPIVALGESGLPVDVLKSIDLERDRVHGDWQYDGQALVSPADDIQARLQLPAIVPESYQLDLVAQRESGNEALILTVPVAGTQGTLVVDDYGGKLSGLQMIDGQKVDANETKHEGSVFADGKRHLVRVTVQRNQVRLVCDGNSIVDWTGDLGRLKPSESLPRNDRIYLASWQSRYRLTQIKLRPFRGDALEESSSVAGEPTDLFRQIDVKRDGVNGNWRMENGVLVTPKEDFSKLMLPAPPSEEYRLRMLVERLDGQFGIIPVLVVGGRQVAAAIDSWDGNHSGLERLDGKDVHDNSTTRRGKLLTAGKAFDLVFTVRRNSVRATIDGKEIFDWTGDVSRLSVNPDWALPDKARLGLMEHATVCRISKLEITPLSKEAEPPRTLAPLVEPSPPKATPPDPNRKFADLASDKETRLPVPDDDAQKEARKEMQKKLSSSLKGAKTPEQKRLLAQDLAQKPAGDDKAYAYVALKQAIDLAEAAGEIELAWQIVDQLAKTFAVDGMALRNQSLAEIGKAAKSPDAAWLLTDAACRLMTTALLAGDATAVKKAGSQAQSFAKRTNDRALQKDVNGRATDAGKLAAELEAVAASRERLKTAPDDPEANFTLGHFELCASGDFDKALPKLAKGNDEGWKKLAADELGLVNRRGGSRVFINGRQAFQSDPADAPRELAVADEWWSRADEEPWPAKHHLRMRAARWYGSAYRSLIDAGRVRAAERLRMLLATDDGFPHWELFNWRGSGQPNGEVIRLERGTGLETAVEYAGALDVTIVVRTTGTDFRLSSHNWSWGWNFKLLPNQWHTLRFVITPISKTAFVDGVPLDNETWKTPRTFNSAPVSVHMTNDDIAEIRRFIVRATD